VGPSDAAAGDTARRQQPAAAGIHPALLPSWNEKTDKYAIRVKGGDPTLLHVSPNNVVLENGTTGVFRNIPADRSAYFTGTVLSWNETSRRYTVRPHATPGELEH